MLKDIDLVTRNHSITELYERVFRSRGIRVHCFPELAAVRAPASPSVPEAIVVDLECLTRAERSCCRKLKELWPKTTILLLGHDDDSREVERETGADGFLKKPFPPTRLVERVRELRGEIAPGAETLRAMAAALPAGEAPAAERLASAPAESDPNLGLLPPEVYLARSEAVAARVRESPGWLSLASFTIRIDALARFKEAAGDQAAARLLREVAQALAWWMWRRVAPERRHETLGCHLGDGHFESLAAISASSEVRRQGVDLRALLHQAHDRIAPPGGPPLPPFTVSLLIRTASLPDSINALVKRIREGQGCAGMPADAEYFHWIDLDEK